MPPSDAERDQQAADLWDAAADERQRLADEREQLANEREYLADERERLADEHERELDDRVVALANDPRLHVTLDEELRLGEAEAQLARADARLQRAMAERDRARAALARHQEALQRRAVDEERVDRAAEGAEDHHDDSWEVERRRFVAAERERVASVRDEAQSLREELADLREHDADQRDRAAHVRELGISAIEHPSSPAPIAGAQTPSHSSHNEVLRTREAAERQRQTAARMRQRAAGERADARRAGAGSAFAPDAYGPMLTAEFVELTRHLFATHQLKQVVARVLQFAASALPGDMGIAVAISGGAMTPLRLATDAVAEQLDAYQLDTNRGPTVEALHAPEPVHAVTLAPWPELNTLGAAFGVSAALAQGLAVPRERSWHPLGVMTVYAESSSFDEATRDLCSIFAAYLAVAAGLEYDRNNVARREAALHRALGSRDVIGQAKGILMERQRIPAGEAFDILQRTSQRLNVQLREVAARLAESGELPS